MKVFVAEGSTILREQIIELLSELIGIEIIGQAQGALEACCAVRELKPDVVTLDIRLNRESGIDALRKIKKENHAPIVIMLTNYTSPPYRKRCAEAGADFFLDKSNEFGRVKEIIQSLLERFNSTGLKRRRALLEGQC